EAASGERSHARASQAQQEIQQLARPLFDVRSAARRVLEPGWNTLSVVQREEFVRLFGDHLLWGYLSLVRGRLSRDRPPTIRLVAEEVGAGGRVALVRTVVRTRDGADVPFDYVMTKAGANWLVRDVVVDGVSRMLQCASRARETPNGRDGEVQMPDKIRVGIVGATVTQGGSGWGANAHVPALKALPDYELKAVCTSHEDTAKASATAFGAERAFHRFSDMAAHPEVDLIVVCVRVPGHRDLVMAGLQAGK